MSVRATDEVQERFKQLAKESGNPNGDFLETLLIHYTQNKIQEKVNTLAPAIESVNVLTNRLKDILNGVGEQLLISEEKHNKELEEKEQSFEDNRIVLQQRIKTLEFERIQDEERIQLFMNDIEAAKTDKEAAEGRTVELQQQIKQLEETIKDKTKLTEEYLQKIDNLSGIALDYKEAVNENKSLKESNNTLSNQLQQKSMEYNNLEQKLKESIEKHSQDMDRLKDTLNIECQKKTLELQQEQQTKLEEQQEKHRTAINEYENKVKDLLQQLEQASSSKATSRPSQSNKKIQTENRE